MKKINNIKSCRILQGNSSAGFSLSVCIFFLIGCSPAPIDPATFASENLPPAYPRNVITDPATIKAAKALETMIRAQKSAEGLATFSTVEILPPTRTVLPYGVGRYEQQTRLPVILTTGPAWVKLKPQAREDLIRKTQADCLAALEREGCKLPLTLTVQEPSGWQVAWLNDPVIGKPIFVGGSDE
jgi:hypothetical protein